MATAAAVAIAPVSASAAQLAAPPIVSEIGDAAGAIGNWLADSGMKLVTDPVTGITKLVTDQIDSATVIGGAVAEAAQMLLDGATQLPANLQKVVESLASGDVAGAIQELTTTGIVTALPLAAVVFQVEQQISGQLGPIGEGMDAAWSSILGMGLQGAIGVLPLAGLAQTAVTNAIGLLQEGDLEGAANALVTGTGGIVTALVQSAFGESGLLNSAIGVLPSILGAVAGSDWAGAGPFGGLIPGATPTAATLAATQAGPLPSGDDLTGAATAFANWLAETGMSFAGDPVGSITDLLTQQAGNATAIGQALVEALQKLPANYATQLPASFERISADLTSGDFGQAWLHGFNGLIGPGLGASLDLIGAVTSPLFTQTGPIGAGLKAAFVPTLVTALPLLTAGGDLPKQLLDGVSDAAALLQSGDPFGAANAMVTGLMGLGTSVLDMATGTLTNSMTILPAFVGGMADSSWATSGPLSGDTTAASAGKMATFSQTSSDPLAVSPTSIPDLSSSSDTASSAPAASDPAPTGSTSDGAAAATGTEQSGKSGDTGTSGSTDTAGNTGNTGATGDTGTAGDTGTSGETGTSGDTAASGNSGDTGAGTSGDTGTSDSSAGSGDGATGDTGAAAGDTASSDTASSDTASSGAADSDGASDSSDSAGSVDAAA